MQRNSMLTQWYPEPTNNKKIPTIATTGANSDEEQPNSSEYMFGQAEDTEEKVKMKY